jgi:hypothetical protein
MKSMALCCVACFIVGFFMIPEMVVGFELGVEITYPLDEALSTGILMCSGSIMGIIYVNNY